jgi:hypothetical protein
MTGRRNKRFSVFLWHRRLGLLALALILVLAVTGILLNHTETLALDETPVENDWLLDWYGLNPSDPPRSFAAGDAVITQWDDQLFFNRQPLLRSSESIRGATVIMDMIAVAMRHSLLLLDMQGTLIEQVNVQTDFSTIEKLGTRDGHLVIQSEQQAYFQSDQQVVNWIPDTGANVQWSRPTSPDKQLEQALLKIYRGEGLSLERILLDLHSGRMLNARWGIYIMDAAALVMLWLGFSGAWVWWSRRRKIHSKKHYRRHHR